MMNTPVYDPFAMAAQRQGVQVLANPLRVEENRYQLDFNLIEEQLKNPPSNAVVLLLAT